MAITSAGYSVTMRLYIAPDDQRAIGRIATAIGEAGGTVTALDIVESEAARLVVDLTANARDSDHTAELSEAVNALAGVTVRNVSDRTFLLHLGGKLEVRLKVPLRTRAQLSMAYTPGVARVSMELARRPEAARNLTVKGNTVAIVTDGSAVLGLGDIGPVAALPVMEGKAALLKRFAGVDGWPICLDSSDTDEIVRAVEMMAPGFGAVNLEDISAPRCFDIEERLRASLDIPVFHDDQHGTSIVTLAALTNALKVVGKRMADLRVAISGAGAAGVAVAKLLLTAGVADITVCDRGGIIGPHREASHSSKIWLRDHTNPQRLTGGILEALNGADVFIRGERRRPFPDPGDETDGLRPDRVRFSQPRPRVRPGGGPRLRGGGGHRTVRPAQPDQQRAGLPRRVPGSVGRPGVAGDRGDERGRRPGHRLRSAGRPAQPLLHHSLGIQPGCGGACSQSGTSRRPARGERRLKISYETLKERPPPHANEKGVADGGRRTRPRGRRLPWRGTRLRH